MHYLLQLPSHMSHSALSEPDWASCPWATGTWKILRILPENQKQQRKVHSLYSWQENWHHLTCIHPRSSSRWPVDQTLVQGGGRFVSRVHLQQWQQQSTLEAQKSPEGGKLAGKYLPNERSQMIWKHWRSLKNWERKHWRSHVSLNHWRGDQEIMGELTQKPSVFSLFWRLCWLPEQEVGWMDLWLINSATSVDRWQSKVSSASYSRPRDARS